MGKRPFEDGGAVSSDDSPKSFGYSTTSSTTASSRRSSTAVCQGVAKIHSGSVDSRHSSERVASGVHKHPNSVTVSCKSHKKATLCKTTSQGPVDTGVTPKRCIRTRLYTLSRVLRDILHKRKRKRLLASNIRCETAKLVHGAPSVLHASRRGHQRLSPRQEVGRQHRPIGCLLPCCDSQTPQEVSTVCLERSGLPIPGSSDGSVSCSLGFHTPDLCAEKDPSSRRYTHSSISGRLASDSNDQRTGITRRDTHSTTSSTARVHNQRGEIGVDSSSGNNFPRIQVPSRDSESDTYRKVLAENSAVSAVNPQGTGGHCSGLENTRRETELCVLSGSSREIPHERNSVALKESIQCIQGPSRPGNSVVRDSYTASEVVAEPRSSIPFCPNATVHETGLSNVHGCVHARLGRPFAGGRQSPGQMGLCSGEISHKCVGTTSSLAHSTTFPGQYSRQDCVSGYGQHNYGCVHQQTGRNQVQVVDGPSNSVISVVPSTECESPSEVHSRETECDSRSIVSRWPDTSHRVVDAPSSVSGSMRSLGNSTHRSVCYPTEHQTADLCVTSTRRAGVQCGRPVDGLDGYKRVCFPAQSHTGISYTESRKGTGEIDPHRSLSSGSAMVHDVTEASSGRGTSAVQSRPTETARNECIPQSARDSSVKRLVAMQSALTDKGFSEEVAARIAAPQRASTVKVYDGRWTVFGRWCKEKGIDPYQVQIPQIADFMLHQHADLKRHPTTIAGYKTVIGNTLKPSRGDFVSTDMGLSALITSFGNETHKEVPTLPDWDLAIVLDALQKPPFEPLSEVSMKMLTLKTVFLVTFGSGRRRSEIHALIKDKMDVTPDWSKVIIRTRPNFVMKNQYVLKGDRVTTPVILQALQPLLGAGLVEEKLLCPVRALKVYLDRTQEVRGDRKNLFIAHKPSHRGEIAPGTITSWIRQTVAFAYSFAAEDNEVLNKFKVQAHQLRGLSASWALDRNVPLANIMESCCWRSHTTFTSHYLRDMSVLREDMIRLGPLVAAGVVV